MRIAQISVIALFSLLFSQILLAGGDTTQLIFDNNIGLMKNVSSELRQELPMCDEFLDVKWIREMPDGYWVGRVIVDVKTDDKTEQRELVVLEKNRLPGHLLLFDVTTSIHRGSRLDELIMSADVVKSFYATLGSDVLRNGLVVVKNRKQIVICEGFIGSQAYFQKGIISQKLVSIDRKICIILPSKERWLINKK